MERIVCLIIGYLFGNFPTGYLYAKAHGVDITKTGSGNIGTTNALRTLGPKAGLITMLGDFIKTFLPLFITAWLFRDKTDMRYLLTVYTGLGAVLGHNYPVSLHFHGGKGVACTGAMIIYSDPVLLAVCFVLFFGGTLLTKYVSVGSLLVAAGYLVTNIVLVISGRKMGWNASEALGAQYHAEFFVLVLLVSALIVFQHRSNIGRLIAGNERKLSFGTKKKQ
ncbi:MAG: glycerol-3-phosphate 1-O-acyltransferase PlsY [Eubacteriales bacterium]|nr:glycerol-3-phosphate 1-O-acyltransferase PlsY [Eubacteriales bacterium]